MSSFLSSRLPGTEARTLFSFFFAQGLCMASWAGRIPHFNAAFADTYTFWGMLLFLIPVGKFIALPTTSMLIKRFGSDRMSQAGLTGYVLSLLGLSMAHNVWLLGLFLFLFGVCWNVCDISFNTQAVEAERRSGLNLMATFHGGWSLGACTGALLAFGHSWYEVTPLYHYLLIWALVFVVLAVGRNGLSKSQPEAVTSSEGSGLNAFATFLRRPESGLLLLGAVGLCGLLIESSMFDWGAVYFQRVTQLPETIQIGFLIFVSMMTVGRFSTNYAYARWGKKQVLRGVGVLIAVGFLTSALGGWILTDVLGFMMVGLGISCVVPTLYSFVGSTTRLPIDVAITILSTISFLGSLVAPLLIGYVSDAFGLRMAYVGMGLIGLLMVIIISVSKVFDTERAE